MNILPRHMRKSMDYILCIDSGSTHLKTGLFDEQLRRLAETSTPTPYRVCQAERVELDPEEVWDAAVDSIQLVCRNAGIQTNRIAAIALTSQAQTFTIVDPASRPVMPLLSWRDRRRAARPSNGRGGS